MSDYSIYPKAIDGYAQIPLAVDRKSPVAAESINRPRSAIINIENTLGIAPHVSDTYGEFENVDERLENSEAILDSIDLQYVTDRGNETTHSLEVQNGTAALPAYTFYQDVNTGMFRPDSDELGFSTSGVEQLRIDDTGQIGIGKINPSYLLDVAGDVNIDGDLEVLGDIHAVGNITFDAGTGGRIILGTGPEDEVDFNADVISDIIPDQDNLFDLGSAAQQWQDLNVYGVRSSSVLAINATAALDMDAASATLDAAGSISVTSSAGPVTLEGTAVSVDSTVGPVALTATGVLDMEGNSVSMDSTGGPISIDSSAALNLEGNTVVIDSMVGSITATAADGLGLSATSGDVDITSDAGAIVVNAFTDLDMDAADNVSIDSTNGNVTINATTGDVQITTEASDIILSSANHVDIDAANSVFIDANLVGLVALTSLDLTGETVDIDGESVSIDSTVGQVDLNAATALGLSGETVDIDGESVTIDSSVGVIDITAATALSLGGTSVDVDGESVTIDSSVGSVSLAATTDLSLAGETVDIDGQSVSIDSTISSVDITANTDLILDSTTGDIDVTATAGEINLNTAADQIILNSATDLDLDATNDVYIDAVKDVSINSTSGDVKVSAVVGDVGLDTAAGFVILNAAGNVGIDSKAPSHKLSVANGNIEVSDASVLGPESLDEIQFSTHAKWNTVNDFNDTGGNAHYTLSAVGLTSSITQPQADLATPGVGKRWYAFTYDVLLIVSFDSDGEVTIGPSFSSPPAKLDLTTGTHTVYFQSAAGPTDFSIIVTSTTDTVGEFTIDNVSLKEIQGGNAIVNGLVTGGGVSGIKILSNGNVGLGTVDPEHLLHVVGDARIQGDLTVNGTVTQIDTDHVFSELFTVENDGTGVAFTVNQTGAQPIADFKDDGATTLFIEDGGNVGLGTNAPNKKLHIFDSYAATGTNETSIVIERRVDGAGVGANGIGTSIGFSLENDADAPVDSGLISTILTNVAAGTETSVMKFSTRRISDGLAERVIIDQDGRVGIGEFDPKSTLSVGGSASFPIKSIAFVDSPYAVLEADYTILADASGGNVEVNLPNAQNYEGRICNVKKIDASANAVSMIDLTPNDIDGALSKDISIQWVSVTIQSDGSNWYII